MAGWPSQAAALLKIILMQSILRCHKGKEEGDSPQHTGSLQRPPHEDKEGREVLLSEREASSQAHQSFENALCRWFRALRFSGELLPLTDEWCQTGGFHNASWIFKTIYFNALHTTPQVFVLSWIFLRTLIKFFLFYFS